MSYNLNFYPNDINNFNNTNGFGNNYNPYTAISDYNSNFQKIQQDTQNRLQQLQSVIGVQPHNNQYNIQQGIEKNKQPYYLFCGDKEDWDEFLLLNYGITEQTIFDDYKLFLQAKQELQNEQGQNKINVMKDRIKNMNNDKRFVNVDSTIKSNVKPEFSNSFGNNNGYTIDGSNKHNNVLLEQNKTKPKNIDKQK